MSNTLRSLKQQVPRGFLDNLSSLHVGSSSSAHMSMYVYIYTCTNRLYFNWGLTLRCALHQHVCQAYARSRIRDGER